MNKNQQLIIQSFGLTSVKTAIHIGAQESIDVGRSLALLATVPRPPLPDFPSDISKLGTPIFDTLKIKGGSYSLDNGKTTVTYDATNFDSALITLHQTHNVVLTTVQGKDNEVIEYIGKASFRINIKGGIFGSNNNRPRAEIDNLVRMLNSNQPLEIYASVYGGFLSEWNISQMVILDKDIPQMLGGYNYQLFEFNAIEDVPVILAMQQLS